MRLRALSAALIFLVLCCVETVNAANYYEWRNQAISQTWWSASAQAYTYTNSSAFQSDAVSRFSTWWSGAGGAAFTAGPTCNQTSGTAGTPTAAGQTYGCQIVYSTATQTNASGGSVGITSYAVTVTCTAASTKTVVVSSPTSTGATVCGTDHCSYTTTAGSYLSIDMGGGGGYAYMASATNSGNACTAVTATSPTYTSAAGAPCVAGSVNSACAPPTGTNCGSVNGDPVCLSAVPSGSCATLSSGAMVCGATAKSSAPPAPNNGSSTTTPATPTATMTGSGGSETNYYSTTTINNQASSGSSSSGSSGGAGSSSSASSGSATCGSGATCDTSNLPSTTTDKTIASVTSTFVAAVQGGPLYTAVSAISASVPSGTCPVVNITVFDHMYDLMEAGCQIWDNNVATVMSSIMLAFWSLSALWIVLRA